jgi:hypothetical protein
LAVPKTKAAREGFPAEIHVSKEQQDCPTAILYAGDALLLQRNIVSKRPEATTPDASFRSDE